VIESLSDRRRRLLRDEIASIAIDLFARHGYDSVTVEDIAEASGTSQRTFFRYFASKDDVVLDLLRRLDDRLLAAVRARPAEEGPVTALREGYRATSTVEPADRSRVLAFAAVLAHAPTLRARARGERVDDNPALIEHLAGRLGADRDDRRIMCVAAAMSAVASAEFQSWANSGGRGDPSDRIVESLALLERGLQTLDQAATS